MSASAIAENEGKTPRRPYETVSAPDQVPLYDLVQVKGPEGQLLDAYRGVRRRDTSEIVSVVSARYQLVQHREVAQAGHAIGEALERPVAELNALDLSILGRPERAHGDPSDGRCFHSGRGAGLRVYSLTGRVECVVLQERS